MLVSPTSAEGHTFPANRLDGDGIRRVCVDARQRRVLRSTRVLDRDLAAEPSRYRRRCSRAPMRSPSSSSTFRRRRVHRGPKQGWVPTAGHRGFVAPERHRRSTARGSRTLRECRGSVLRASVGSRSGSTANGLPFAFQLHPRRRRLADRHGGLGRAPARSRSGLLERGPPGPSGRGRAVLAVARARKAPRTAGRSHGRRARRHPTGSSRDQPIRVVGLRRGSLNQRTTKRVLRGRAVSPRARSQFAHGSSAQSPT